MIYSYNSVDSKLIAISLQMCTGGQKIIHQNFVFWKKKMYMHEGSKDVSQAWLVLGSFL